MMWFDRLCRLFHRPSRAVAPLQPELLRPLPEWDDLGPRFAPGPDPSRPLAHLSDVELLLLWRVQDFAAEQQARQQAQQAQQAQPAKRAWWQI